MREIEEQIRQAQADVLSYLESHDVFASHLESQPLPFNRRNPLAPRVKLGLKGQLDAYVKNVLENIAHFRAQLGVPLPHKAIGEAAGSGAVPGGV